MSGLDPPRSLRLAPLLVAALLHAAAFLVLLPPWMGEDEPWQLGLSRGSAVTGDRDLVFRAWGARDRLRGLRKMAERAGWRLWAAAALWLTATALLVRHLIVGAEPANSRGRERARS